MASVKNIRTICGEVIIDTPRVPTHESPGGASVVGNAGVRHGQPGDATGRRSVACQCQRSGSSSGDSDDVSEPLTAASVRALDLGVSVCVGGG
jgi:hypothetical protein